MMVATMVVTTVAVVRQDRSHCRLWLSAGWFAGLKCVDKPCTNTFFHHYGKVVKLRWHGRSPKHPDVMSVAENHYGRPQNTNSD